MVALDKLNDVTLSALAPQSKTIGETAFEA